MKKWENNIRKVVPYVPGEQPKQDGIIKLNTNENPYGPSPRVKELNLNIDKFRLYPDPKAEVLVDALAQYHGLKPEQVFVGVGSDDVLAMSFMTFFNSGKPIFFPDVTYSFYDVWADMLRIPYEKKAVDDTFKIVADDYYGENGGVVIANPNAPTGIVEPLAFVEDILQHNQDVVVIIDEAYIDFGGKSAIELIDRYDNLLVVRTYSKSRSMAGIRIGYAMGNSELIGYLNAVKYSYNSYTMNMPSLLFGVESLKDDEYFKNTVAKIVDTREWFKQEIKKLGFSFPDSSANFVFITHESIPAIEIFEKAKQEKIYVRHFNAKRVDNYLRVSIGTREEMEAFLELLKKMVSERS